MYVIRFGLILLLASIAAAQEPGEAESREKAKTVKTPTTWAHPATEFRGVWLTRGDISAGKQKIDQASTRSRRRTSTKS